MDRVNDYKNCLLKKYRDYKYNVYYFNFEKLYRGRPFKKGEYSLNRIINEIQHTKKLWAPPWRICTKQRCNLKKQPLLYLSSSISSIPLELVECEKNDFVCIIEYSVKPNLSPISIVGWEDLMEIKSVPIHKIIKDNYKNLSDTVFEIDRTFSEYFRKKRETVRESEFDSYDITIALTKLFLAQKSIGLIYPSVAAGYKSFNLACKPQKVKDFFIPKRVGIYEVLDKDSFFYGKFEKKYNGIIKNDGTINWKKNFENIILVYEK